MPIICEHCMHEFFVMGLSAPDCCSSCRFGGHEGWTDTCPVCATGVGEVAHA